MEYGRWGFKVIKLSINEASLNPCCNGIWSVGLGKEYANNMERIVLILVVMEYGRWVL